MPIGPTLPAMRVDAAVLPLRGRSGPPRTDDLVVEVVRQHAPSLLALARRHSLCADDAHDAYQRALEIFLKRAPTLERRTMVSWLRTVVKHEAWAVRQARQASVSTAEPDLDLHADEHAVDDDERVARFDRLGHAAEALQRLKPQEVRALLLKAEGHSYEEICAITGWSYTKVNRCLTEGRRAFKARYAGIEAGDECERWAPVLSAVADGEATAEQLAQVRPHLRACAGCRATVREYHATPGKIAAILPVGLLTAPVGAAAAGGPRVPGLGVVHRVWESVAGSSPAKMSALAEAATSGKLAAVAASTVAIAGGGLAVDATLHHRSVADGASQRAEAAAAAAAAARHHRAHHAATIKPVPVRPAGYTPPSTVPPAPKPSPAPAPATTTPATTPVATTTTAATTTTTTAPPTPAPPPAAQFSPESSGTTASTGSTASSSAGSSSSGGGSSASHSSAPPAAAEFSP